MATGGNTYQKLDAVVRRRMEFLRRRNHKCFNDLDAKDLLQQLKSILPIQQREKIERMIDREGNTRSLDYLLDTMVKYCNYAIKFLEFLVDNNQRSLALLVMQGIEVSNIDENVPTFVEELIQGDLPPSYDQSTRDQADVYRKFAEINPNRASVGLPLLNDLDSCGSASHPSNIIMLDENVVPSLETSITTSQPLNIAAPDSSALSNASFSMNTSNVMSSDVRKDPAPDESNSVNTVLCSPNSSRTTPLLPISNEAGTSNNAVLSKPNLSTIEERPGHYAGSDQQKFENIRNPKFMNRYRAKSNDDNLVEEEETIPKDVYTSKPVDNQEEIRGNIERHKNREDPRLHTTYSFETAHIGSETVVSDRTMVHTDELCISATNSFEYQLANNLKDAEQTEKKTGIENLSETHQNESEEQNKNLNLEASTTMEEYNYGRFEEKGDGTGLKTENKEVFPNHLEKPDTDEPFDQEETIPEAVASPENISGLQHRGECKGMKEEKDFCDVLTNSQNQENSIEDNEGFQRATNQADNQGSILQPGNNEALNTAFVSDQNGDAGHTEHENPSTSIMTSEDEDVREAGVEIFEGTNNAVFEEPAESDTVNRDGDQELAQPVDNQNEHPNMMSNVAVSILAVSTVVCSWILKQSN